MVARDVQLVPGVRYYAGVDLPWFVPRAIVTSAAHDIGFADVVWHAADERPPIRPETDPLYESGWSEWATGIYRGEPQQYHFGVSGSPHWIVSSVVPATTSPAPAVSQTSIEEALKTLRIINGALESGDPNLMRQAGVYFSEHNMPELGRTLLDAADRVSRGRAERIAAWAAGIGATVAVVGLVVGLVRMRRK